MMIFLASCHQAPQAVFENTVEVLSPNEGRCPLSQNRAISSKPVSVTSLGCGMPWSPIRPIHLN